ncbi:hypothetical protein [uncultured Aquimarina sp.]|uniref:hypothetical protein n=1 Tax=uncultured Aquimarina sp. TaxID=575652 RepID=UPI00262B2722|nr:hypothetical protein [uncultured Aquimarina sp.]
MKKIFFYLLFIFYVSSLVGQIDAGNLLGLPTATDFTEINGITGPQIGALVYNLDDDQVYRFTSTGWQVINGENIYSVNGTLTGNRTVDMGTNQLNFDTGTNIRSTLTLRRTNNANALGIAFRNSGNAYPGAIALGSGASGNNNGLDFYAGGNEGDPADLVKTLALQNDNQIEFSQYGQTPANFEGTDSSVKLLGVNSNGDIVESNTTKSSRIFYPPSIAIDASSTGTGRTVDLYDQYLKQYSLTPDPVGGVTPRTASSNGAPGAIPSYNRDELYYYVTYADPFVFNNISIGGTGEGVNEGVMTYDIIGTPPDFNSLINVVFVVK